jgi:hypothetical protein
VWLLIRVCPQLNVNLRPITAEIGFNPGSDSVWFFLCDETETHICWVTSVSSYAYHLRNELHLYFVPSPLWRRGVVVAEFWLRKLCTPPSPAFLVISCNSGYQWAFKRKQKLITLRRAEVAIPIDIRRCLPHFLHRITNSTFLRSWQFLR